MPPFCQRANGMQDSLCLFSSQQPCEGVCNYPKNSQCASWPIGKLSPGLPTTSPTFLSKGLRMWHQWRHGGMRREDLALLARMWWQTTTHLRNPGSMSRAVSELLLHISLLACFRIYMLLTRPVCRCFGVFCRYSLQAKGGKQAASEGPPGYSFAAPKCSGRSWGKLSTKLSCSSKMFRVLYQIPPPTHTHTPFILTTVL